MVPSEPVPGLYVDAGSCNAALLVAGGEGLLINPGNPGVLERSRALCPNGLRTVLFTHHRRELADGIRGREHELPPDVRVPAGEAGLFSGTGYFGRPDTRWHLLCGHVPYHVTHAKPVPFSGLLRDGDVLPFGPWRLRVTASPGYTDGAVSLLASRGDLRIAFTGDLIYAPGQVRDLYCLQHEVRRNGCGVGDYHGYAGSSHALLESLGRVLEFDPALLVPAHGEVMRDPKSAVALLGARFAELHTLYAEVSALRWYFPDYFADIPVTDRFLPRQATVPLPDFVRTAGGTSRVLLAEDGAALLIDLYGEAELAEARRLLREGIVSGYDGIWITHYHYDHMENAGEAAREFGCPIMTDPRTAAVLRNPDAYLLTCLSPKPLEIGRVPADGETFRWRNFALTAFSFPGQTLYHSGLLAVPDKGPSVFFAGDSFTPTGIDDYCTWNRNLAGEGQGYRRCMQILRDTRPDMIVNQHVGPGFRFDDEAEDRILRNLDERHALLAKLLPWEHPDFGVDEYWVHTYPYSQAARAGVPIRIEVRVTNHAEEERDAVVRLDLPDGWHCVPESTTLRWSPRTESVAAFDLTACPAQAGPGLHVIPVFVRFAGRDLGSFREALVELTDPRADAPGGGN